MLLVVVGAYFPPVYHCIDLYFLIKIFYLIHTGQMEPQLLMEGEKKHEVFVGI